MSKEDAKNIEQAFDDANADDVEKKVTDETEEQTQETTEDTEVKTEVEIEKTDDVTEPPEKSFTDLGAQELEGKSREEIARYVREQTDYQVMRDRVYGEQANELGGLRRFKKEHSVEKPKAEEPFPDLSEGQIADFNAHWEKNPGKAIVSAGMGNYIKQAIATGVQEILGGDTVKAQFAEQQNRLDYESWKSRTPDHEEQEPLMQALDGQDRLGSQGRTYDDLCDLARLGNGDDPLYGAVYSLMYKHPTMPCSEARKNALLASTENSQVLKDKVKKDVQDIDTIRTKPTGVKASKKSEDESKMNLDEVFEKVDEEEKV